MTTSTPASSLLVASELIAGYLPGVNILNGCNFYANQGELVGIIGPNGAGKSTLLKSLFGLVKIGSGTVTLLNENITNMRADQLVQKGIGFVPQSNNVFPSLTIEENLQMGAYQSPEIYSERFEFVTNLFPILATRRKQRAGSLSGGERQKLGIARAILLRPPVVIFDEISNFLDNLSTNETIKILESFRGEHTVILVTHDKNVMEIADQIIDLDIYGSMHSKKAINNKTSTK